MGLKRYFANKTIFLDTAPLIYYIEEHPAFVQSLNELFVEGEKTPDAIQLAAAIHHATDCFLTNDKRLKPIREANVILLDEINE